MVDLSGAYDVPYLHCTTHLQIRLENPRTLRVKEAAVSSFSLTQSFVDQSRGDEKEEEKRQGGSWQPSLSHTQDTYHLPSYLPATNFKVSNKI